MQENKSSKEYWNNLYSKNDIGWDIGFPSPALREYIDQIKNKEISIFIPGCGNAYEAEYLAEQGFSNITVIDIAALLTEKLKVRIKSNGTTNQIKVLTGDFFEHTGKYDLILEQTFLSALDPSFRPKYVDKMHELLQKGGHLAGVLFSKVFEDGPPFGGTIAEYETMFAPKFIIKKLEPCSNSIERREGSEVFINLISNKNLLEL